MDVRKLLEFLKKPSAKLAIAFLLIFAAMVYLVPGISRIFLEKSIKKVAVEMPEQEFSDKANMQAWQPLTSNSFSNVSSSDINKFDFSEDGEFDSSSNANMNNGTTYGKNGVNGNNGINSSTENVYELIGNNGRAYNGVDGQNGINGGTGYGQNGVNGVNATGYGKNGVNGVNGSNAPNNMPNRPMPEPLNIYNSAAVGKTTIEEYLPYGQLIDCQLVITLQSNTGGTPVLGLVTKDIYNDGKLIIPAGSEIHGRTKGMPQNDKIFTEPDWVLVFRTRDEDNGKEIRIKGVALENGSHWNGKNWDLLDGSAGIRGFTTDKRNMSKLKDIAVSVTEGLGTGMANAASVLAAADPTGAATGVSALTGAMGAGAGSALSGATSKTAKLFAEESLVNILQSEYFVTAPAGTQFYLYTQGTLDFDNAKIGATIQG